MTFSELTTPVGRDVPRTERVWNRTANDGTKRLVPVSIPGNVGAPTLDYIFQSAIVPSILHQTKHSLAC